jgi:Glycosyl transferase family 2
MRAKLGRLYRRARAALRPSVGSKLAALTATHNEDWVLGLSLRASLMYCDVVVITDHGSNDATAQIIAEAQAEFPERVIDVRRTDHGEWKEADIRQEMLERARRLGATHFVIADADELPTGNRLPYLRARALSLPPGCCATVPMVAPYLSLTHYRWDGFWGERSAVPWAFADSAQIGWVTKGNYQVHRRRPGNAYDWGMLNFGQRDGGLFHLQFVNKGRLQSKSAWYKMMETVNYPGQRSADELNQIYDWTLQSETGASLRSIPREWWLPYEQRGWLRHLQTDAAAWQLGAAHHLLAEHGRERFSGLNLHGLI